MSRPLTPLGAGEPRYLALAQGGSSGAGLLYFLAVNSHDDTVAFEDECLAARACSPAEAVVDREARRARAELDSATAQAFGGDGPRIVSEDGLDLRRCEARAR